MVRLLAACTALLGASSAVQAFVPSSLSFLRQSPSASPPATPPSPLAALPRGMALRSAICEMTGKRPNRQAMIISFSHKRTKTVQHVNLQRKRLWWPEGNRFVKMRISTKALRTINKYGIHLAAKKYGVDLNDFSF